MNLTQIAWRNIGRNRRRSVLSVTATAVATMSVVMLFSLLSGIADDMASNLTRFYTGEVRIRNEEFSTYEYLQPLHLSVDNAEATVAAVEGTDGVAAAVPRISGGGAVFQDDRRIALLFTGVDFEREREFSNIDEIIAGGEIPVASAEPAGPSGPSDTSGPRLVPAVVGAGVLDRLGIGLGDRFTLVTRTAMRGSNAMSFEVAGVARFPVPALNDAGFWAPLPDVQRLVRMDGEAGEVLARMDRGADERAVTEALALSAREATSTPLEVKYWKEIETTYSFIEMAQVIYSIMGLIFFILAGTVIINTTMMAIYERKKEIGTLEAMGMTPREVVRLFFTESLFLAILGAGAGLVVGVIFASILSRTGIDFTEAFRGVDMEISPVLYPKITPLSTVVVTAASIAVGAITSLFPTTRITRIQPVEALRDE